MRDYVVAIDLGTSCTAFSWRGPQSDTTVCVPDTAAHDEDVRSKTPTALLIRGQLDPQRRKVFEHEGVEAFGRDAERRFCDKESSDNAQLFQRFKMELHKENRGGTSDNLYNATTTSFTGVAELKLRDAFSLALEHIKDAALENLARARVKPNRVSWVLTVPACCTAPATKFMSDAAIRAGLINGEDDAEHLTICKEPVAACLALEDRLDWSVNDMYLVVDCGGGTVDICAFKLAQLGPPILDQVGDNISEPWGSTYVDEQFRVFLMTFADSVAPRAGHFQLESFERDGMYKVLQNWEEAKVGLSVDKPECRIDMSEMVEALGVSQPAMAMDTARKKTNNGGQDLVGGSGTELVLKPALLTRFFRTQCDRIAGAVSEKLKTEELRGLKSVVMVGGFAGSMHVQAAVRKSVLEEYPNKSVQVVVATSPDLAVVQGAALYVGPLGPRPKYPTSAPEMNGITCGSSYGILTSGRGTWDAKFFEAVLLKGEAYPNGHTKDFDYTVGSDCKLAFGSCGASEVKEGRNRLDSIGGIGAVHITVSETIPVPGGWDMCCCRRSTSAVEQDENGIKEGETPIKVEFTIIGVVLHVKVKSKRGRVLMKQVVPGCGS